MEFSKPEYWSGYPIPSPVDLPHPGIKLGSPALQGGLFTNGANRTVQNLQKEVTVYAQSN